MASDRLQFTVPNRDSCRFTPILVILLGKIFSDDTKRQEICGVIDARSRFVLTGSNHFWPTYTFIRDAENDVFGNSGTITDIYDVAATAKGCGWKSLAFIDELSWRQHKGITTNHEDPTLSATVVNLECEATEAILSPESTFYIRRLPIVMALAECFLSEPQKPKDWSRVDPSVADHAFQLHLHTGFYLYNPHEPIFSDSLSNDLSKLHREALGKVPNLPEELKDEIMAYVHRDQSALQDLIDTDTSHEEAGVTLVQPLVYLKEEELAELRGRIKDQTQPFEFKVGQWKEKGPASRRDLARIIRHFNYSNGGLFFAWRGSAPKGDLEFAVYDPPTTSMEEFKLGAVRRASFGSLKETISLGAHRSLQQWRASQLDRDMEVYIDPTKTFPLSLPAWYKQLPFCELSRERDRGHSEPQGILHTKYLAFYLTDSLSHEERQDIESMVAEDDSADVGFTFIPWEGHEDGGPKDMLCVMKMLEHAFRIGFPTEEYHTLVFIDRQSAEDRKVIVCTWRLVLGHGLSGIIYGRLGEEIPNVLVNVPGNMDLQDWVPEDEIEFYRDPEYTGPLVERGDEECLSTDIYY